MWGLTLSMTRGLFRNRFLLAREVSVSDYRSILGRVIERVRIEVAWRICPLPLDRPANPLFD